jgi:hypothetical protein
MRTIRLGALLILCAFGLCTFGLTFAKDKDKEKEKDFTSGAAENKVVSITATPYLERDEVTQAAGADLGPYVTAMRITVQPKAGTLRIDRDDFTLLTFKTGEHTTPLSPSELGSRTDITVKAVQVGPDGPLADHHTPLWSVPGMGNTVQSGNGKAAPNTTTVVNDKKDTAYKKKDPLVELLKQKVLPEKETDQPVSGLLLFNLDKQKLKDLELIYKTSDGPLKVRFK